MANAISQKDHIWSMVNEDGTVEERVSRWHKVLSALELTFGLWSDLCYAYKAVDICDAIDRATRELAIEEEKKNLHHLTAQKHQRLLEDVKQEGWRIRDMFYKEHTRLLGLPQ